MMGQGSATRDPRQEGRCRDGIPIAAIRVIRIVSLISPTIIDSGIISIYLASPGSRTNDYVCGSPGCTLLLGLQASIRHQNNIAITR